MRSTATRWKEYRIPILVTVLLHGLLLGWLASDFVGENKLKTRQPDSIKATLVKRKEVKAPPKKPKASTQSQKTKKANAAARKRKAEKERQAKIARQKADKAKKAAAKKERDRLAKQKADAKKKAQRKAKQEADALKKKQEAAAEAKREAKRIAQEKAETHAREQALLQSLAEEEAVQEAVADEELAMSYMGAIQQTIEQNWSRPPSARNGMEVTLEIQLVPNGAVVQANVIDSSGNAAFDRSAVLAVTKSERFPEVVDLPNRVFEKYYRKFRLRFKPEDLRL